MHYRLVLLSAERTTASRSWNLHLPVTVGRGSESPLCIDDESISRSHCQLYLASDESLMVRDLGSTNGTYVNGDRIRQPHSLVPGDVLQLGSVSLRVDYHSDTDPGPAPIPRSSGSSNTTQKMPSVSSEKFTMMEVKEAPKRWWEFWRSD